MTVTSSVLLAENGNRLTQESGGGLVKEPVQWIASDTATLSFQHTLTLLKNGSITVYLKDLFGALPFVAAQSKSVAKRLSASLSFAGFKLYGPILRGAISFIGSLPRRVIKAAFTTFGGLVTETGDRLTTESSDYIGRNQPVALTFSIFFSASGGHALLTALLTASLSFTGSLQKRGTKALTSSLSFVGNVIKRFNRTIAATLSFVGNILAIVPFKQLMTAALSFVGTLTPLRTKMLTAALSFVGTFHKFTPILHLSSALSFVGAIKKKSTRSFASTISFIGNFAGSPLQYWMMTASLSFSGNIRPRMGKLFAGILSWIGSLQRRFNNLYFIVLSAMVSLSGVVSFRYVFGKVFPAMLRFRSSILTNWGTMMSMLSVSIMKGIDRVLGVAIHEAKTTSIINETHVVTTTPTTIDLAILNGRPANTLFIKNNDFINSVDVDVNIAFNAFPQRISPRKGIYLLPSDGSQSILYAKASAGTAEILIIAGT